MIVVCVLRPEDLISILGIGPERVDCAGLKLTLSEVYSLGNKGFLGISERVLPEYKPVEPRDNKFFLDRGVYVVRYGEYVRVPSDAIALAIPRSSLLRMGVTLYTAVWDPGYEGRGYGLLSVFNEYGVVLEKGVQIAQLVFIRMTGETQYVYRGVYYGES